ncbi:MAG: helix-turn-helix domain-containing protein, partial [Myxococcota bacterium]
REDLYYRMAVLLVDVPPLRRRPGDVTLLAQHLLDGLDEKVPACRLSPQAICRLESHSWPGNVRELENELQRALALALPGESLGPERFLQQQDFTSTQGTESFPPPSSHETLRETLVRLERQIVSQRLREHGGRRTATARSLGVTREGLWKKLKRLGIE